MSDRTTTLKTSINPMYPYVNIYDVSSKIEADFECIRLATRPSPAVCLYPDDEDIWISQQIRSEGLWEPRILTKAFQNILFNDTRIGVLDIGANIGIYSLLSAAMGHNVIAIEPTYGNLQRLHKAINIGNFQDRIVVVRNAVSDRREAISIARNVNNQGGIGVNTAAACNSSTCLRSIYMDDLTTLAERHFPSRRAVIKVDIEGFERFAFRRCDRLLDSIYVPFIFMEWQIMVTMFSQLKSADRRLVDALVARLTQRGYKAFCARSLVPQRPGAWNTWAGEVVWKHKLAKFK